jgi:hypothetical protein
MMTLHGIILIITLLNLLFLRLLSYFSIHLPPTLNTLQYKIEKNIKEIVEQIIKEVVEEINMETSIRDPPKFRRNDRDRKQIRKFLIYYRDLREMKDKRSEYEEEYKM